MLTSSRRNYSFRYVEIKIIDTSPKWQVVFSEPKATAQSSVDYAKLKKPVIHDEILSKIYDAES